MNLKPETRDLRPGNLISGVRSLIFSLLFYPITFVYAIAFLPLLLMPRRVARFAPIIWCNTVLFLLRVCVGLKYHLKGIETLPKGPYILASQHQSAWDTFFFPALFARNLSIVLKQELMWIPLIGFYLRKMGMIPINRKGSAATLRKMLAEAQKSVSQEDIILIFPEGQRSKGGGILPLQPGIAALYRSLQIPVVGVCLNSGKFWGKNAFLKHSGEVEVEFLPPILPGLSKEDFLKELRDKISQPLFKNTENHPKGV